VYFEGRPLDIVGRVSMDSITIDLGDLTADRFAPGAQIELIGPHQSVDELAIAGGTIGYEILTGLGHRYQRIYRDTAAQPQDSVLAGDRLQ
jgi:alanine racemase